MSERGGHRLSLRLHASILDKLSEVAGDKGVSKSVIVRDALIQYFARQ